MKTFMKVIGGILVLGSTAYVSMWGGYNIGTNESARKLIKHIEENPDQTMSEFAEECSNK